MKIWSVQGDVSNYTPLVEINEPTKSGVTFSIIPRINGSKLGNSWPRVEVDFYDKESKPGESNFSYLLPGTLVCDDIALSALSQDIWAEVEVLPIYTPDRQLHLLNVTNIVDCLNHARSEIKYFRNSKDVKRIMKYAFNTGNLKDVSLFKIPELLVTYIFATNRFKAKIEELGLTGLKFELVYDDEQ
jgi:hypothetical protein